jgi:hypothetical protein
MEARVELHTAVTLFPLQEQLLQILTGSWVGLTGFMEAVDKEKICFLCRAPQSLLCIADSLSLYRLSYLKFKEHPNSVEVEAYFV